METLPIPQQRLTTIVEGVSQAQQDCQQAFALLIGAKKQLGVVLGTGGYHYYNSLWPHTISDSNLANVSEEVHQQISTNAWKYVIDQCGLKAYMTEARQKELQKQLIQGQFPVLTVENILATLQGLSSQVGILLQESAKEVFDWLRPRQRDHGVGKLKTNKQWDIGSKAIVGYSVEANYNGGFHLNYNREANFRALGNVFSLLEGHGAQHYPDDICTQLNEALKITESGMLAKTSYLALRPFRNGNAHLNFLRQDLVDRLNQLGGDGTLPGKER